jgi:hypothetical protein
MLTKSWKLFLAGLLLLWIAIPASVVMASGSETASYSLSADRTSQSLGNGNTVKITVQGSNMSNIYGVEAKLSYSTDRLQVKGSLQSPIAFRDMKNDADTGDITVFATHLGNASGTSGNAGLFTITFEGKSVGQAEVRLLEVTTIDKDFNKTVWNAGDKINVSYVNDSGPGTGSAVSDDKKNDKPVVTEKSLLVEARMDESKNAAVSTVDADSLNKAKEQAASTGKKGAKTVVIEISEVKDAKSYALEIPTDALQDSKSKINYEVVTSVGKMTIPSGMLSNTDVNTDTVSVSIGKADVSALNAKMQKKIGDQLVLELHVQANGETISWKNPKAPVTITTPYTPSAEELKHPDKIVVWYIDEKGEAHTIKNGKYDPATGQVTFSTTHFSVFTIAFVNKTFSDIEGVAWAQSDIEAMAAREIINGMDENQFKPQLDIKRSDYLLMLMRALELDEAAEGQEATAAFEDTNAESYYSEALALAKELGIVKGDLNNRFRPDDSISRQDAIVMAQRAMAAAGIELPSGDAANAQFRDSQDISSYAADSVAALAAAGVIRGNDGSLHPKQLLTRAQSAVMIHRLMN